MKKQSKLIGALYVLVGVLCMCYPIVSSLWVEIFIGAAFLAGGIFALFNIPSGDGFWGKAFYAAIAVLYAVGGVSLLMFPVWGTVVIMIMLGAIFFAEGVIMLAYWSTLLNAPMMLVNAIVTLVLGILVLANINDGLWFIGMLVGIDLIFRGFASFANVPAPKIV